MVIFSAFRNVARMVGRPATLRQPWRSVKPRCRSLSSSPDEWLSVKIDDKTGIATLTLQRAPANTLNLEFMTDIAIALEKLDNEKHCRGLVIASAVEGIYSGGLQLDELYQPKEERIREVWRVLQEIWIRVYGSRLATVAAINGHALAGGCLLSLSCDYRVMAEGNGTIGLSGAKLGIVPPSWLQSVVVDTIGHREAEWCISTGHLYPPAQALEVGLVDKVVPAQKLLTAANEELKNLLRVPDVARQLSKDGMRRQVLRALLSARERDTDQVVAYLLQDDVQRLIGAHFERLKSKEQTR